MAGMVKRADFLANEVVDLTEEIKLVSPTDTPLTTTLNDGYQWSQVKPKAEETLEAYFLEMRKNWEKGNLVVRISHIENRLLRGAGYRFTVSLSRCV